MSRINKIKKISSYKYQFVAHNASEFENYNVISVTKSYTNSKIIKVSRGLVKLSFRAGIVFEDDRELRKNVKIVCSKCHISGSLQSSEKD